MSSVLFFLLLLLTITHATTTADGRHDREDRHGCLTDQQAQKILYRWISFFEKIDPAIADKTLTDNFQEYTASINFLFGKDFDAVTADGKSAFIEGQIAATANSTLKVTVLDTIHTCNIIVFRWQSNDKPIPFVGFDWLYLTFQKGKPLIYKAYSEFNNAAALFNAGLFPCPAA
ncbi:hypothetical protein MMC24_003325 [Lignoscripta atroalba]|nr:hypothetical protein [Lignoscripta atroalba]